jgi:hypothetical protein
MQHGRAAFYTPKTLSFYAQERGAAGTGYSAFKARHVAWSIHGRMVRSDLPLPGLLDLLHGHALGLRQAGDHEQSDQEDTGCKEHENPGL